MAGGGLTPTGDCPTYDCAALPTRTFAASPVGTLDGWAGNYGSFGFGWSVSRSSALRRRKVWLVLVVRGVGKSFGDVVVLADVTFTVEPGEVVALTGVNGSGKSTLLRCIVGWDTIDTGQVLFEGNAFDEGRTAVRAAVAVGIEPGMDFSDLTVREHLEFMARAHGNDTPDAIVGEVLDELDLTVVADHFPFALSQGQQRRMGLASCFVRPRRLLILDEPEQNLDVQGRQWLAEKIRAERAAGVSVLMACHNPDLVARVADSEVTLGWEPDDDLEPLEDQG